MVLNRMSDGSTLMAMKRMNIVAAELDRRARLVIAEAPQAIISSGLDQTIPRKQAFNAGREQVNTTPEYRNALQWDWGNDGVDAWPSMDFSIVSKCH